MSSRNLAWLTAISVIAAALWVAFGWLWGVAGALVVLVASELVERTRRRRRRAARGDASNASVLRALKQKRTTR